MVKKMSAVSPVVPRFQKAEFQLMNKEQEKNQRIFLPHFDCANIQVLVFIPVLTIHDLKPYTYTMM